MKFQQQNHRIKMTQQVATTLQLKLKSILQLSIDQVKPKLRTKTQLTNLQNLLIDYVSLQELGTIIENVLHLGISAFSSHSSRDKFDDQFSSKKNIYEEQDYLKLEEMLQKYQNKVRNYIRNQQQMKLYSDQLENKVKELEESKHQLVLSTKKAIVDLKRDNQMLIQKMRAAELKIIQLGQQSGGNGSGNIENKKQRNSSLFEDQSRKTLISRKGQLSVNRSHSKGEKNSSGIRSKLDQYSNMMESIQASRSRRGSISSMKMREKQTIN